MESELNLITILLASVCIAAAFGCVIADRKKLQAAAVAAKVTASTCFVLLAFFVGAAETGYGRAIITALLLSWLGDVLLLSQRSPFLLAGIAAFFLAHIGFAIAFAMNKISTPILAVSLTAGVVAGILLLRWLWSYLRGAYRWAVPLYILAIVAMVSLAASAESLPAAVAVGGVDERLDVLGCTASLRLEGGKTLRDGTSNHWQSKSKMHHDNGPEPHASRGPVSRPHVPQNETERTGRREKADGARSAEKLEQLEKAHFGVPSFSSSCA